MNQRYPKRVWMWVIFLIIALVLIPEVVRIVGYGHSPFLELIGNLVELVVGDKG